MNTPETSDDALFLFELKVARRADLLSQRESSGPKNPLELWCEAERDVLGQSLSSPSAVAAAEIAGQ